VPIQKNPSILKYFDLDMPIKIKSFVGSEAYQFKHDLAKLRIKVFREYPYLYDGTLEYEERYLETFLNAKNSIIAIAFDQQKIVGASTGVPLEFEPKEVQEPWIENNHDLNKIFYFSESVLLENYRGMGIGVKFFEAREAWAKSLGMFNTLTFCGVVREEDHPGKPSNYEPLNKFWEKRGFTKLHNYVCQMAWKEIDETKESPKTLQFWHKEI
jgi:GNAT superfamily N-acetyltransferase